MEEHRIPPAVSFHFEQIIALAAEHARLEPTEWAIRSHELMGQLEHRWREGIDQGLSTDEAERRAVELFGDPVSVGRRYQKPMEVNLLYSRAWQAARLLLFLFVSSVTLNQIKVEFAYADVRRSMVQATRDLDGVIRDFDKTFKKGNPSASKPININFVPNLKEHVALWLKPLCGGLDLSRWAAAIAPFLIAWNVRRTGTARFEHPLSQLLLAIVIFCVVWVTGVNVLFNIWNLVFSFKATEVLGILFVIALTCVGSLCIVAETIDLPSRRKWRLLKLLGYKT